MRYGIGGTDPGAVPGASTKPVRDGTQLSWGRNRIDVRSKVEAFVRHGTVVNGLKIVNGKNRKPINGNLRVAANMNGAAAARRVA